jgi:plasmid maintenance system antidote protein VapI
MKTIVDQLRKAIADSNETEYAIAKGSGVSQSGVNRFVNGERSIGIDTAAKLCVYLRLSLKR